MDNSDCKETKELINAFYHIHEDCLKYKNILIQKNSANKSHRNIKCNVYLDELYRVIHKYRYTCDN